MGCQRLQITSRLFSTSSNKCGYFKNMKQVVKNMKGAIVWEEDLDKRPSDLEIKDKDLPTNTPTLEHRIMRDQVHKFHVYDRKAGYHLGKYGNVFDYIDDDMTLKDVVVDGARQLKEECKLALEEVKYYAKSEHFKKCFIKPGDVQYLCNFAESPTNTTAINDLFTISSDSTWGEGYSMGSLEASSALNSAIFCGDLSTTVPQDGRLKRAGYSNMKLVTQRLAFGRIKFLDFDVYDAIVLRIRGDGRTYMFNIHTHEFLDVNWMDLYSFPVHTRGGPYWQDVVIPFSKFFLQHRGFVQDKQPEFMRDIVKNVSITIMDQINGPFHLEIEYIGLKKLQTMFKEINAYEQYRMPHGLYLGTEF